MPHPWMLAKLLRKKRRREQAEPRFVDLYTGKGRVNRRKRDERRRHVQARAHQRYKVCLTNDDVGLMEEAIQVGCVHLLAENVHKETALYELPWWGEPMYVVYDTRENYIRTVLPEKYARQGFRF
jgi:hypothetical protein